MADDWMDKVDGTSLEDSLASLSRLVDALGVIIQNEDELDAKLKEVREQRRMLEMEQIPGVLQQHGLSELRLVDGRKVIVTTDIKARIPAGAESRRIVLKWIMKNGGSGLIHDEVTLEDPSEQLMNSLIERGDNFTRTDKVNTNSFQALLRELLGMKKGFEPKISATDVPKEAGLFVFNKTKIQ